MSFIDGSAVNVALPVLERDFGAGAAATQWVIEGYALFLSALLLAGGALGDRLGQRSVFGAGIALFALGSIACALSPTIEFLIAARCIQGVGGALAVPGSLALVTSAYDGAERGKAIGVWSGFSAMSAAIGPVLGGWLVQTASWRYVFAINLPFALFVLFVLFKEVPESRDESAKGRVDVVGAALATFGLGAVVYGLIAAQNVRGDALAYAAIGAGVVALIAFLFYERSAKTPMLPFEVFRSSTFSFANVYTFFLYAALGGSLYFLPFDLIDVQGYSPAAAGAAQLPFVVIMFALSRFSGGLVARIGPRIPLLGGALLAGAGFLTFAFAGIGKSYWVSFFPGSVLLGFGGALFVAPLTTTVMGAVERAHTGLASGVNNAVSRVAGLLAIALLGLAFAGVFHYALQHDMGSTTGVGPWVRGAVLREEPKLMAGDVPESLKQYPVVTDWMHDSYDTAFSAVMILSSGLCLIAAGVAFGVGDPRQRQEPA
ncbi:MAG: DHA2 family efflux MFS transporter permease subunit [Candidatus Eremiobacteraeota bacterium]|nr:DHA2 family efflux MFS transporter permease subunit [Candidatus Eremiobacteraeota bacterium]